MTPTPMPAELPVGPQHDEDDYTPDEVRLIIEEHIDEIAESVIQYDPFAFT